MKMMSDSVRETSVWASELHANQTDKVGAPYVEHVTAVRDVVALLGGDDIAQMAAVLHDAVEDGHTTLLEVAMRFGNTVAEIVDALTKRRGESNDVYLSRVIAAGHRARLIKIADLLHNTRPDRTAALCDFLTESLPGDEVDFALRRVDQRLAKYRKSLALLLEREIGTRALATATRITAERPATPEEPR